MAKKMRQALQPGYDGAVEVSAKVRLSLVRSEARTIRGRPGSFEVEYGAKKGKDEDLHKALYHAGVHYSGLWERAHISIASPNFASSGSSQWKGLPDSRADALSEIRAIKVPAERASRLIDYCILGKTSAEIGAKYDLSRQAMARMLKDDLMSLAQHLRYVR